jgi:hypothetical protein
VRARERAAAEEEDQGRREAAAAAASGLREGDVPGIMPGVAAWFDEQARRRHAAPCRRSRSAASGGCPPSHREAVVPQWRLWTSREPHGHHPRSHDDKLGALPTAPRDRVPSRGRQPPHREAVVHQWRPWMPRAPVRGVCARPWTPTPSHYVDTDTPLGPCPWCPWTTVPSLCSHGTRRLFRPIFLARL